MNGDLTPKRWTLSFSQSTGGVLQVWPAGSVPEFIVKHEWINLVDVMPVPKPMDVVIVPRMSLESVVGNLGSEFEREMHLNLIKSCLILPE